ncbi:hypothetical protein GCM10023306_00100 [Novosphingobium ginsenosidimutans]
MSGLTAILEHSLRARRSPSGKCLARPPDGKERERIDQEQWIDGHISCPEPLQHGRRRSLRLVPLDHWQAIFAP